MGTDNSVFGGAGGGGIEDGLEEVNGEKRLHM